MDKPAILKIYTSLYFRTLKLGVLKMTEEFKHPTIGSIRGLAKDCLLQFLGVKYALLQDRFAEPELVSEYNGSTIDATKVGPQALSDPLACEAAYSVFQQSLPHQTFDISDRDCLHLTITIPREAKDLPVFIFIHGGRFTIGSNAWPQYDQTKLVRQGVEMGMPFIGVGVNYRVGVPGFLTSADLRTAGYKPNNGIRDQRAALIWVQKFISGFGGDPNKITLAGQSAGAGR
ncbi:unnamed protein product [Clonostachys rosea f. rosea IK726]|uniref:Carboxylic ester hydrolase n=2 Tax=Bionectria ochroleuca TaxID=29856 RepID=A0A0B7KT63_BIOOC|nr:unnamed protein product [Clonostachys rosea f. rosea IK726]